MHDTKPWKSQLKTADEETMMISSDPNRWSFTGNRWRGIESERKRKRAREENEIRADKGKLKKGGGHY